jgi:hypothetical protein
MRESRIGSAILAPVSEPERGGRRNHHPGRDRGGIADKPAVAKIVRGAGLAERFCRGSRGACGAALDPFFSMSVITYAASGAIACSPSGSFSSRTLPFGQSPQDEKRLGEMAAGGEHAVRRPARGA